MRFFQSPGHGDAFGAITAQHHQTGPYFHDGKVATLGNAIRLMAEHRLGRTLNNGQEGEIRESLAALKGEIPAAYVAPPALPDSGPNTPMPDPT